MGTRSGSRSWLRATPPLHSPSNSIRAVWAPSPARCRSLMMRVSPPGRAAKRLPNSVKSLCVPALSLRRRSTRRRACRSPRRASVISRSANGRNSLAFASVVTMRSCLNRLVAMLFSVAFLWLDVRDSWRPLARCRISELLAPRERRGGGRALVQHANLAVQLFPPHPEVEPFAAQQLGDFAQRLLAHVLHFEEVVLAVLHEVAQRQDVGILERIDRADREAHVVDRARQRGAQAGLRVAAVFARLGPHHRHLAEVHE